MKRLTAIAFIIALLVLALPAVSLAANPHPSGRVVVGMLGDAETLNPLLSENQNEQDILNGIFDNLLKVDDHGNFLPDLATQVPTIQNGGISKDGLVYTFHLRKDVKWHDGEPFTAKDVIFTWKTIMNPKVPVVSRSGFDKIAQMTAPDPYTVIMRLKEPFAPFLLNWSGPGIVPEHILAKVPADQITKAGAFSHHPIGTGPFMFKEWKSGSYILLTANKNYFGKGPYLSEVVFKVVPDSNTLLTQLRTHEIDVLPGAQPNQYSELTKIQGIKILKKDSAIYAHITPNTIKDPILADKRVRQALEYALPRQEIVAKILNGIGRVASAASITPTSWAFNPNLKPYPFDLNKAKALLAEAGWKPGPDGILQKDGRPLKLTISTNAGNKTREMIEQIAQQYWRQIGVDLQIQNYEPTTFFGDILDHMKFDLALFAWVSPPDPDETTLYASWQIPDPATGNTNGQNYAGYKNPEIDKILKEAVATPDMAVRKKLYWREQEILHEDLPLLYLYYYQDIHAYNANLLNYRPSGTTVGNCWNIALWQLKK